MTSETCGTCDGKKRIYDWNPITGDPCPDCNGMGFTVISKVHMAAYNAKQNRGCAILLAYLAGLTDVVYGATELVSMVTRT